MQWIRSVLRSSRRLVGTDLDGNKYYEILREGRKPRREVITNKNIKHEQYTSGIIPIEWEAWLRGSAKDPPAHNDLLKKQREQLTLSKRVQEIHLRDKQNQEKEYTDGLVARPLGHASSPSYGHQKESSHPQTTGRQFRPGVWEKQIKSEKGENDERVIRADKISRRTEFAKNSKIYSGPGLSFYHVLAALMLI